ncbi:LTA synthase family protein [Neobacillus niacini]|uniref:LTA synthase family protein n=1 Tax=Neobacillus niacini TaxID=86668 RepID=UPI0021CB4BB6|nr:LTA synthase family protein [Neobacillus niacini]MCM3763494.1 LTA synthase family protein [Neobacillus niacini]
MKKNKVINSAVAVFFLFLTSLLVSATIYIKVNFPTQNMDEMIFYLFNGVKGTSIDVVINAIIKSLMPFLIFFILLLIPIKPFKRKNVIVVKYKDKNFSVTLLPIKPKLAYSSIMLILSLMVAYYLLGVHDYFQRLTSYSSIIDDHYVDGKDVSISFPKDKRNLIILYIESAESTFIDKNSGGGWDYTVIPELESIANENINFSNSDKIGGALPTHGTGWTVAGLISTTSGIPLKIPGHGNEYTNSDNFLAGAYTLGDILEKEGYNQEVMFGSDASFGGRNNYYIKHGNHKVFDYYTAIDEGKMSESEKVWWGFEDSRLFDWAKEEITHLASLDKPFNFTFLTANTHFPDGYVETGTETLFESQYENVFAHTSKQVFEFVSWLKNQHFYEDTTIIITGDHHSMQDPEFFKSHIYDGYERTIYNAFINSAIEPINPKNRLFTQLDMFPTILASIGVEIEGDRLGLGTNLFSNRNTLAEEAGVKHLDVELGKNSKFYNTTILQSDYLELMKKAKK